MHTNKSDRRTFDSLTKIQFNFYFFKSKNDFNSHSYLTTVNGKSKLSTRHHLHSLTHHLNNLYTYFFFTLIFSFLHETAIADSLPFLSFFLLGVTSSSKWTIHFPEAITKLCVCSIIRNFYWFLQTQEIKHDAHRLPSHVTFSQGQRGKLLF